MRLNHVLILLMMVLLPVSAKSQNREVIEVNMTLEEVIEMAQRQSLSYFRAKNMYLAEYWSFRSFKASRLPSLNLTATPVAYTNSLSRCRTELDTVITTVLYRMGPCLYVRMCH